MFNAYNFIICAIFPKYIAFEYKKFTFLKMFVLIFYAHMLALIWRHVKEEFYWILQKIVHTCFDALSSVKESEKRRGPKFGTRGAKFHSYGLQSGDQDCNVEAR